jgi:hypothetical protein
LARSTIRKRPLRKFVCLFVVLNLLLWPAPGSARAIAKLASSTVIIPAIDVTTVYARVVSSLFDTTLFEWIFGIQSSGKDRPETLADRIARISEITVSPEKFVGYVGDKLTFVAIGSDLLDRPVQGAKFQWLSSNPSQITIDDAGRASFLKPGLVRITCSAGSNQRTVPVLIRPGSRPIQTDAEWRADQESLDASVVGLANSRSIAR